MKQFLVIKVTSNISNRILILWMWYEYPNSSTKEKINQKSKSLLELKMTGKCLKQLFQQCRSINSKIFSPLATTRVRGELCVALKQVILDTNVSVIPKKSLDTPLFTPTCQQIQDNFGQYNFQIPVFICSLAAPQPTLGHYWGDHLIHLMLVITFVKF